MDYAMIMADGQTGETHPVWKKNVGMKEPFLSEGQGRRAEAKGIYVDRTSGGDCRCFATYGDSAAGPAKSEEPGTDGRVSVKPAPMGPDVLDVCSRQRRQILSGSGR